MNRKGIILAGGFGTRLYPITHAISKQILPVYDKPLIYYPLTTLMLSGITDILIITTSQHYESFKRLLGNGSLWGINLSYEIQSEPNGIAEAFIIGESFIGNDSVTLILGDNIFYSHGLSQKLQNCYQQSFGATIFGYYVNDPKRYGIVCFDENNKVKNIVEKPTTPTSHYAVTGLYFYDNNVIDIAKQIKPSQRGELEITDINNEYIYNNLLDIQFLSRGSAWLDAGTYKSLLKAAEFIRVIEERQSLKIGCPEEVAWRMGYIDINQLESLAHKLRKNEYGQYLYNLISRSY